MEYLLWVVVVVSLMCLSLSDACVVSCWYWRFLFVLISVVVGCCFTTVGFPLLAVITTTSTTSTYMFLLLHFLLLSHTYSLSLSLSLSLSFSLFFSLSLSILWKASHFERRSSCKNNLVRTSNWYAIDTGCYTSVKTMCSVKWLFFSLTSCLCQQ